jgi:hypothetical protein
MQDAQLPGRACGGCLDFFTSTVDLRRKPSNLLAFAQRSKVCFDQVSAPVTQIPRSFSSDEISSNLLFIS